MIQVIRHFIYGLLYGSLLYVVFLLIDNTQKIQLAGSATNNKDIIGFLIVSGLIGLLTIIFDLEKFSFLGALIIHFIGTAILILLLILYEYGGSIKFMETPSFWITFWITFLVAYIFIWGVVRLNNISHVNKINLALNQRRKNKNSNIKNEG